MELKQTRLNDSKQDNTSAVLSQGLSASALRAPRLKRASGFTLIEVMVVIVILGVLAALIVPNVMGRGEKAKVDTTQITLKGVAGALDQFKKSAICNWKAKPSSSSTMAIFQPCKKVA